MYYNNEINYLKYLKEKSIIIFGAGKMGVQGLFKMQKEKIHVTAFCDNDQRKENQSIYGIRVISFDKLREINRNDVVIVICSGFEREIKIQLLEGGIYNFISVSQIDFGGGEEYYDEQYFSYQKEMGEFSGKISASFFQAYIGTEMVVAEFGSGGGYLLKNIVAKKKIGIEINDTAREIAEKQGIDNVKSLEDLPDNCVDIIISNHALEHVENPLGVLRGLRNKLKNDGQIVFVVPNESCDTEYQRSEINNHLYTWNCLTLGNLFKAAGFFVQSVEKRQTVWPKHYFEIQKEVSPQLFETICEIGGKAYEENICIIVASK